MKSFSLCKRVHNEILQAEGLSFLRTNLRAFLNTRRLKIGGLRRRVVPVLLPRRGGFPRTAFVTTVVRGAPAPSPLARQRQTSPARARFRNWPPFPGVHQTRSRAL